MGKFRPGLNRHRGNLFEGEADDLGPSFVEYGLSGPDIPLPGARIGASEYRGDSLFLCCQSFFILLALGDVTQYQLNCGHLVIFYYRGIGMFNREGRFVFCLVQKFKVSTLPGY